MDKIVIILPPGDYKENIDLKGIKTDACITLQGLSPDYSLADAIRDALTEKE